MKIVEGPGVSREAELKEVINDMSEQLKRVRGDNKRLKEVLKNTEDECDCLQNCYKENTRLEEDLEKYRRIIKEMMSQSKSLTRTAREMGFYIPGHSGQASFDKDKASIKRTLMGETPGGVSRASSRTEATMMTRGGDARSSRGGGGGSRAPSAPPRSEVVSRASSRVSMANDAVDPEFVVDGKLVKLDAAVTAAMTARDDQLRGMLRQNMKEMGLDDQSIIDVQDFQEHNVDYVAELETVFNRAKELADLAEEYR